MKTLFLIIVIGYLLGFISIKGISLGNSMVMVVALCFGHFGAEVPAAVQSLGLILFVSSVGLTAGPMFFQVLKQQGLALFCIGVITIISGIGLTTILIFLSDFPQPLLIGLLTGALTTTPGLAAALDCMKDPMISVGYGIAYPFGVIGVVLFVQLMPRILTQKKTPKMNLPLSYHSETITSSHSSPQKSRNLELSGIFLLALVAVTGILLGNLKLPLPNGLVFSLGTSGGPLVTGILIGCIKKIGNTEIKVPAAFLEVLRELGLVLFLCGAGVQAGKGFVAVLDQYGLTVFIVGVCMTLTPMLIAFFVSYCLFKMNLVVCLGCVCGGMTSTPALGSLIASFGTENAVVPYASAYSAALLCIVIGMQFLCTMG